VERFRPAHVIAADRELAERVHAGEEEAIRSLVDRYGRIVYGVARHFVTDADRADAATVHTFLQAWRSAELFEPGRDFAPWLASLVRGTVGVAAGTAPPLADVQRVWSLQAALAMLVGDERDALQASYGARRAVASPDTAAPAASGGVPGPEVAERATRKLEAQMVDGQMADDLGSGDPGFGDLQELLAAPATWEAPRPNLGDRVLAAIEAEAVIGPPTPMPPSPPSRGDGDQRRSWMRPVLIGVAATMVFLFGGLVVLAALNDPGERRVFDLELVPTGVVDDAAGSADLIVTDAGIRVDLDAVGLPRREGGRHYAGWLELDDGTAVPIGSFHDGIDVVLWGGVEFERVERLEITLEDAVPVDDPAQASSGRVALKASFADATER
jgi:hypothetical protein